MVNSLEERLKTHSSAFDGLLSLIPAKYYYDESTQDQWKQKKKSKQELKQNKRTKLNPEVNDDSAKEVSDFRANNANEIELPKKLPKPITEDEDDVEIPDMDVSEEEEQEQEDDIMNDNQLIFDDDGNEVESESFPKQEIQQQQQQKKKNKTLTPEEKQKRDEKLSNLREKLAGKINNLKEKRKALGTKVNGAPQSREQILSERKRKAELKKRKHQELDDEESDESDNEMSGSDVEQESEKSVLYGNIVFEDGSQVTSDLTKFRNSAEKKKLKGPANNDLKAHLLKLEQKKKRLADMTPEDQAKQQEKDKWQRVLAQAEGIKVKDDEKLLKKAIKRKDKQKLKSEIEWKERKQIVKDTVSARAKRREENLKSRRENKGKKSKNQPKLKKFTGIVNKSAQSKKKRAGFEGSAKSKFKK
ncbi:Ribosomal RNA-processing protein 14 [Spathaspora sp. JA1]|nr:Ribosomal RNA-processing protein 14 [Spathaspora sp. JA1]